MRLGRPSRYKQLLYLQAPLLVDRSVEKQTVTASAITFTADSVGRANRAYAIGTDGEFVITQKASINNLTNFTAIVRTVSNAGTVVFRTMLQKGVGSRNNITTGWITYLQSQGGNILFAREETNRWFRGADGGFSQAQIAYIKEGVTAQFYYNGLQVGQSTINVGSGEDVPDTTESLRIFRNQSGGDNNNGAVHKNIELFGSVLRASFILKKHNYERTH